MRADIIINTINKYVFKWIVMHIEHRFVDTYLLPSLESVSGK